MDDTSPAPAVSDSIRWMVDVAASFPGGEEALREYLSDNMIYPAVSREIGSEGIVHVQFVVLMDGRLADIQVRKTAQDPQLDGEALRLVKLMPNWSPARLKGMSVSSHATVHVVFRIRD